MPECSQSINFGIQTNSQYDHFESQNGSKMSSAAQDDIQDGPNQKMIKNGAQFPPGNKCVLECHGSAKNDDPKKKKK